jgi:hypothetical protein
MNDWGWFAVVVAVIVVVVGFVIVGAYKSGDDTR